MISLACIKHASVFLVEPQQNSLINPEAYSETCQISKMVRFA